MAIFKIFFGLWKKLLYKIKDRFYGWSKCQNLVQTVEVEVEVELTGGKKFLWTIEVASAMIWTYGGLISVVRFYVLNADMKTI